MRTLTRTDTSRLAARYILPPTVITCVLWVLRVRDDITFIQAGCAAVLLCIAWVSYCKWQVDKTRSTIPVFGMLAFAFWVFYALPLFWQDPQKAQLGIRPRHVSEAGLDNAMLMVLFGVCCLWLGMRSRIGARFAPRKVLDIRPHSPATWHYVQALAAAGVVLAFIPYTYALGEGGRQIILILMNEVPLVAFAIVLRRVLAGSAERGDKFLVVLFLAVRTLAGVSSGWLGAAAVLGVVCAVAYAQQRRKVPTWIGLLIVGYTLFLQPAKETFRKNFWYSGQQATTSERLGFWLGESVRQWQGALTDDSGEAWKELASRSFVRTSLLTQSADVLEMTPSIVPYQHGRLYSYMLVTLIPRFLWPDKPSSNESNRFYQVAYGLTLPQDLNKVSIAVGTLAESYISFGWLGVPMIMIPLGIFFGFFHQTFLSEESGYFFNAIGLAMIPNLLMIEAQLAQYLGGIIQALFVMFLALAPILFVTHRSSPAEFPRRRVGLVPINVGRLNVQAQPKS